MVVSVCMITYNHAAYIAKAIESVLGQRAPFDFELVIGDDCSTDGTRDICETLQKQYPDIIRYAFNATNIGMNENFLSTYARCTGEFVAMLEGDDEWINPAKLQKQVQILEQKANAVLCYSNALINDTRNPKSNRYFNQNNRPPEFLNRYQAVEHCVIPTCTVVFRNRATPIPDWFAQTKASAYFLFYLLSKQGDLCYLDEETALYNHHYAGMSRTTDLNSMLFGDSVLLGRLLEYFDKDPAMEEIVLRRHINAVNDLFHRAAFGHAARLFWRLPVARLVTQSRTRHVTLKLLAKVHLLFFLSKREKKGVY